MRKLNFEQLDNFLATNSLTNLYLLVGTEQLLLTEAQDLIGKYANAQGITDKQKVGINNTTKWAELYQYIEEQGLFSSQKLLSLQLPDKLISKQQQQLLQLSQSWHTDIILSIQLDKLPLPLLKQKWFTLLAQQLEVIQINCNSPEPQQLGNWIKQRAKLLELQIDNPSIELLAYTYEGNLLALNQVLQQLKLLYGNVRIEIPRVEQLIAESAIFKPYMWIDALLVGNFNRAIRILKVLQQEDIAPVILLRILQKELQQITEVISSYPTTNLDTHFPVNQLKNAFNSLNIWQIRRNLLTSLLQRLTYRQIYSLWQQLFMLEKAIKVEFDHNIWLLLEQLCYKF